MSHTLHRALVPRDGLFCKDGRGWNTSAVGRSHGLSWPPPSTLRGALRAAYGEFLLDGMDAAQRRGFSPRDWDAQTNDLRITALLSLRRPVQQDHFEQGDRVWPVPADVYYGKDGVYPLRPQPPIASAGTLGSGGIEDEAEHLWPTRLDADEGKPTKPPAFWSEADFVGWLCKPSVGKQPTGMAPSQRTDINLKINADRQTAEPGLLFSSEIVQSLGMDDRLPVEWALGLRCESDREAKWLNNSLLVGGRRRPVLTAPLLPTLFDPPSALIDAVRKESPRALRLIQVTPGDFLDGWRPPKKIFQENGWVLRAAIVRRPLNLSTWDMVKGSARKTRRLVQPGSVYFIMKLDESAFTIDEIKALWLSAWGENTDEGCGLLVPGLWNPKEGR